MKDINTMINCVEEHQLVNTYQFHTDTHAVSLFDQLQAPGQYERTTRHCLFDTVIEKNKEIFI